MNKEQDAEKFEHFRSGFPATKVQTYLSNCDKMILHDDVRTAIDEFLDHLALASANRVGHEVKVSGARDKFAKLVNSPASTVAVTRNVSDGTNSIAWSIPMQEGDNVILTTGVEHPNNIYPWLRQQKRGIEVRSVAPNDDGSLDVESMIEAIDSCTKVMTCASVTYSPGHRADLQRLGEACRKNNVFFLVDGVQSAGILHHDFSAEPIDGFATSASKGLLGLYGFGFLYVSERWIERLEPAYLSRPGIQMENNDHSAMGNHEYNLQPDSRRFEVGSYNLAGAYAVDRSLDLLLALGTQSIEKHVLNLAATFHEGLLAAGVTPAVPGSGPAQSHILTIGTPDEGGHGFSTNPMIENMSTHLQNRSITHTIRRGQLRFSMHGYNNEKDIAEAVDAIKEAKKRF